jgi:hypothetical protein
MVIDKKGIVRDAFSSGMPAESHARISKVVEAALK